MAFYDRPSYDQITRISLHLWIFSLIFSVVAAEVLAIVLILLWIPTVRRHPWIRTPLDLPVIIFLLIRLLSVITAVDPATSLQALRKIPFLLVFFPVSRFLWRRGPGEMAALLRTLVVAGLAATAVGLYQVATTEVYRLHSTTGGPSTLSLFLAVSFVAGVALAVGGVLRPLLPWILGLAATLWALAFTYNRAPWFAAVVVGVALVSRWRRWVSALVLLAAVVMFTVPGFRVRNAELLSWPPKIGDRLVIWQVGWSLVAGRPILGYGPETFDLLFDRRAELKDQQVGAWHSFVLQILVESGITGLLAFVWILIEAIQLGRSGRRWPQDPLARSAATALLAGVNALLLAGLFGGLIGDPVIDLLFWGLVGCLAGFALPRPTTEEIDMPVEASLTTAK